MGNEDEKAVSGIVVEEKKLNWVIQNFSVVKSHDEFIKAQKFEFEAGVSIGLSSKWWIYFKCNEEEYPGYIGIFLKCLTAKPQTKPDYLIAECGYTIKKKDGTSFVQRKIGNSRNEMTSRDWWADPPSTAWRIPNFVQKTGAPLVKGSLVIHVKLRLYASSAPLKKLSIDNLLEEFHSSFKAKDGGDLARLIKLPVSCSGGIEIFSRDGKQFQARKEVLAVRSPVFEAMFRSHMKESAEGKLELPDISSKTVEVLLHYFCTGELLPAWRKRDVILELTNAAAKYQLQDLLGFLDRALGKVCDDGNVLPLLNLVDKLDLKNAKEGLVDFMKKEGFIFEEKKCLLHCLRVKSV